MKPYIAKVSDSIFCSLCSYSERPSGVILLTTSHRHRSPPKLSVDVIPDDRSTKDPEPTAFPESESLGATEICGPATISLPVGFETWSAEEEEKFEESKRRLLGPMGYDDLS
nr:hypothetical transcript [Hymenolepis microstoma]